MNRLRAPILVLVALVGTTPWLGCGSTPRDQNIGMDATGYEPPAYEAPPSTGDADDALDAGDETSSAGGSGGAGGTAGAGGTGGTGAAGTSTAGTSVDAASDAISDAGADG
jgi:hypothetical protein